MNLNDWMMLGAGVALMGGLGFVLVSIDRACRTMVGLLFKLKESHATLRADLRSIREDQGRLENGIERVDDEEAALTRLMSRLNAQDRRMVSICPGKDGSLLVAWTRATPQDETA